MANDAALPELPAWRLRDMLRRRDISARELTQACIDEMERRRELNIFITEMAEEALRTAEKADERIAAGKARALEGIPLAVKDNFCTRGTRTTAASRILRDFVPPYESTVSENLRKAGAVFVGKANMDEFAMGSSTESSHFGPTLNPRGKALGLDNLSPGGSSGGSAAAVAAGVVPVSIGTDTGGSIRQPASFCGVVGMKPTYGLCSRWGIIAYASSLDQAGAFGRTVRDVAMVLDAMAGADARDTTSIDGVRMAFEAALEEGERPRRVAIPRELRQESARDDAGRVWQLAEELAAEIGVELVEVSMPHLRHALPAYYIIALSEASSNLARYDGVRYGYRADGVRNITDLYERTRSEGFGREVQRRILMGTFSLSAGYYDQYYNQALKVRRLIAEEFARAFEQTDVMLMPTAPGGAFEIGAHGGDPVKMYLEDIFTVPVNLAGLPALSLPVATDGRGMPLGLQVIGPRLGDAAVLRMARALEEALDGRA